MAFLVGGANSAVDTEPYDIDNSLRFNDDDDAILTYTPAGTSSDASKRKYTFSFWVKRGNITDEQNIINWGKQTGSDDFGFFFDSDDTFRIYDYGDDFGGSGYHINKITSRLFRDPSAWYHIILIVDTTDGTAGDRVKLYINGVRETSFSTSDDPDQNYAGFVGSADACDIGWGQDASGKALDAYISEFHYIDGTAKAHTDFGEFDEDSGIWKPKEYTGGSYGTNGFFLEFKQSGTGTNSSGMGADTSGNDNHLAVTNLTATDQTTDTPTNNFCTMNPLDNYWADAALAEGNLQVTTPSTNGYYSFLRGTMGVASGKWYWEVKAVSTQHADSDYGRVGFAHSPSTGRTDYLGRDAHPSGSNGYGLNGHGGGYYYAGSAVTIDAGGETGYRQGEILHFALDLDNNKIWWGIDGTWLDSGDPTSGATGTGADAIVAASSQAGGFYSPAIGDADSGGTYVFSANFGNPAFAISSGNADDNGYGNFEFDVPTGFYALCTKNLAEFG